MRGVYRNREISSKTKPRVLFLGDSITFGDYLPEEETFVRRVETLSVNGARPLETVNAGIGAIGLQNALSILMEMGIGIDPDVVVIGFYLNDFRPPPGITILMDHPLMQRSRFLYHGNGALARPRLRFAKDPDGGE